MSKKKQINITTTAAGINLKDDYRKEARARGGIKPRNLMMKVIKYAVRNTNRFLEKLVSSREKGGKHISIPVDEETKSLLKEWAVKDGTTQAAKANFILEKALENGLIDEILEDD